jgi:hypothetical protein
MTEWTETVIAAGTDIALEHRLSLIQFCRRHGIDPSLIVEVRLMSSLRSLDTVQFTLCDIAAAGHPLLGRDGKLRTHELTVVRRVALPYWWQPVSVAPMDGSI